MLGAVKNVRNGMKVKFQIFLSKETYERSTRDKLYGSSSFNPESGDASINLNDAIGDEEENEVQELPRPIGRYKSKALKKKGVNKS